MMTADRQAQEENHAQFAHRVDVAHIFVTGGDLPKSKPYKVLGDLKYRAPFSTVAIDSEQIDVKLKAMAMAMYPDGADAVIKVNSDIDSSGNAVMVSVTGEAVQFKSSADRDLMHDMWENLIVSPK